MRGKGKGELCWPVRDMLEGLRTRWTKIELSLIGEMQESRVARAVFLCGLEKPRRSLHQ